MSLQLREATAEESAQQREGWARSCVTTASERHAQAILPADSRARKETPIFGGVVAYFPRALAAVAHLSFRGNEKHNPGQPLHWSRGKSCDHLDCVMRHLLEVGTVDPEDGILHDVKLAWRALANLEIRLEAQALGVTYEQLLKDYREGKR